MLLFFAVSYCQICLEDLVVNEKLNDEYFVQKQLNCILADDDSQCDQFGVQIKRKFALDFVCQCSAQCAAQCQNVTCKLY